MSLREENWKPEMQVLFRMRISCRIAEAFYTLSAGGMVAEKYHNRSSDIWTRAHSMHVGTHLPSHAGPAVFINARYAGRTLRSVHIDKSVNKME